MLPLTFLANVAKDALLPNIQQTQPNIQPNTTKTQKPFESYMEHPNLTPQHLGIQKFEDIDPLLQKIKEDLLSDPDIKKILGPNFKDAALELVSTGSDQFEIRAQGITLHQIPSGSAISEKAWKIHQLNTLQELHCKAPAASFDELTRKLAQRSTTHKVWELQPPSSKTVA